MVLGRDILMALGFYFKLSENIIAVVDGPYELCTAPMVDISTCY